MTDKEKQKVKDYLKTIKVKYSPWFIFGEAVVLGGNTVRVRDKVYAFAVELIYEHLINEKELPTRVKDDDGEYYQVNSHMKDMAFHELYHCIQYDKWGWFLYRFRGLGSIFYYKKARIEKEARHQAEVMFSASLLDSVYEYLYSILPKKYKLSS